MSKRELELYIHIPFCARKCAYCDFLSFAAPERVYREYMDKLIEEICGQGPNFQEYRVSTIFVGGGTPSILPADLVMELFATLSENFDISLDAEVTIEANPGTLTMEKLEVYRQSGVNRLSIGLQSADDKELKYLGRIHSYDSFLKSFQRARQAGFKNINVDLMSALPGQDVHSWKNTLKKVMMLKPEHISAYSLIIEEGTPFYERFGEKRKPEKRKPEHAGAEDRDAGSMPQQSDNPAAAGRKQTAAEVAARAAVMTLPDLPDEDTDRAMYHLTKEMMESHGYHRYEISNYAKKGYECRHNNGYWTGVEYLGLGLGASSYTYGYRYHNTEDLQEYLSLNLYEGGAAARGIEELTLEEKMEEFMFVGLRRMEGVSGSEFMDRFGQNMWNVYGDVLKKLENQGLIEVDMPMVRLTELGIDVSNVVLAEFLLS